MDFDIYGLCGVCKGMYITSLGSKRSLHKINHGVLQLDPRKHTLALTYIALKYIDKNSYKYIYLKNISV